MYIDSLIVLGSTSAHLIGMWVNVTLIIYGTESYLTSLTLKLVMTMGMLTEQPSVGMLSPFQQLGYAWNHRAYWACSDFRACA